jgi:hypothetical protein
MLTAISGGRYRRNGGSSYRSAGATSGLTKTLPAAPSAPLRVAWPELDGPHPVVPEAMRRRQRGYELHSVLGDDSIVEGIRRVCVRFVTDSGSFLIIRDHSSA